ncbi:hypothetical protein LTR84_010232 [Exophiala bonariae]|uniref:AGC-kinase C-terminal domain-containing protein n=1 Tax=Exophiala bonariae TaxID=1690606 RepID=A0AAV9MTY5_9EURO|nr:hypothetical protein LTR84_010232 [Exophiala bonariae]
MTLAAATGGNPIVHSGNSVLNSQSRAPDRNLDEYFVPNLEEVAFTFEPSTALGLPNPSDVSTAQSLGKDFQTLPQRAFPGTERQEDIAWLFREANLFDWQPNEHLGRPLEEFVWDTPPV